jgi:hypothetical protein
MLEALIAIIIFAALIILGAVNNPVVFGILLVCVLGVVAVGIGRYDL